MISNCGTIRGIESWFYRYAAHIKANIPRDDPSATRTRDICQRIMTLTEASRPRSGPGVLSFILAIIVAVVLYVVLVA